MAIASSSGCRNGCVSSVPVSTFQLTIKHRHKNINADCGAGGCIALWLEAEDHENKGGRGGARAGSKDGKNQQTLCPEGEAHHCLKNTALINTNQSESTYPAIAGIIMVSLAGHWGCRVRAGRGWASNPFTRAARSRWIQDRGSRTATREMKLKCWRKTWERWLFHGHASLPPSSDWLQPDGAIFTAAPVHDATRKLDTPTARHMLFSLPFRWARRAKHCDDSVS